MVMDCGIERHMVIHSYFHIIAFIHNESRPGKLAINQRLGALHSVRSPWFPGEIELEYLGLLKRASGQRSSQIQINGKARSQSNDRQQNS